MTTYWTRLQNKILMIPMTSNTILVVTNKWYRICSGGNQILIMSSKANPQVFPTVKLPSHHCITFFKRILNPKSCQSHCHRISLHVWQVLQFCSSVVQRLLLLNNLMVICSKNHDPLPAVKCSVFPKLLNRNSTRWTKLVNCDPGMFCSNCL